MEGDVLGPVVGKNLLNDQRKSPVYTPKRTLASTTKSPRRMLHRSLTSLHPSNIAYDKSRLPSPPVHLQSSTRKPTTPAKSNPGSVQSIEIRRDPTDGKRNSSWLPSVLLDRAEHSKPPLYVNSELINSKGDKPVYYSTGNLLNLDYVDANPHSHRRVNKLLESTACGSNTGGESSSSDSGYRSKQNVIAKSKKASNEPANANIDYPPGWREDDTHLYSDIENCDTLFLDIGAKEPPELIAARNLKGKVKKKKISKEKLITGESSKQASDDVTKPEGSTTLNPVNDVAVSLEKSNHSEEPNIKIKKKIKIVIGKRSKPKVTRKKSPNQSN